MCIDWTDDLEIFPNEVSELEFYFMPCNYMGHKNDTDEVSEVCNTDLEAQLEYLGPLRIVKFVNEQTLVTDNYGAESISDKSKIIYTNISGNNPSYFSFDLQTAYLEDETDLIQLGSLDKKYYLSPIQKQKTDFQI